MRIKTGETATATLTVDVEYECSACGTYNLVTQTIEGEAYTPTVMGINIPGNVSGRAQEDLHNNIQRLVGSNDPNRFCKANFNCECRKCGHQEPWTSMDYRVLNKFVSGSLVITLLAGFMILMTDASIAASWLFIIIGVVAGCTCVGTYWFRSYNSKNMAKLIAVLPDTAMPRILPYSKERHALFEKRVRNESETPAALRIPTWQRLEMEKNQEQY